MAVLPERRQGIIFTHAKPCIPPPGTIGVCGTGGGVGTTHLCIAIANYLCGRFYSGTAYLEMNTSHEIRTLAGKTDNGTCFHHQRVVYYPDMTVSSAQEIVNRRFRYYVLDFGCPNPHTFPAFLRCDRMLVIGSASPWKTEQYQKFTEQVRRYRFREEECLYMGNFTGTKKDLRLLSRNLGIHMVPVPYFPNPFQVTSSYFGFLNEILSGKN